jgi:adenylate kinase
MSNFTPETGRRIVVVGIPGVGKSTVVAKVVELLISNGRTVKVVNYGTIMLEEAAKSHNVESRDQIRKLSIEAQKRLQVHAASQISRMGGEIVIVDTHLFISTTEGFWPGIPMDVLHALKPTNLILVSANPEEILGRRQKDVTRSRDRSTKETVEKEIVAATSLLYASAVIAGCPALMVENHDGAVDDAALSIIVAISAS